MATLMMLINIVSVIANWGKNAQVVAIISGVASLWAVGIFSNFRHDPQNAPTYAVILSMASGLAGIILMIIGFAS